MSGDKAMPDALRLVIEDLELNHEHCPKEVVLQAAAALRRLHEERADLDRRATDYAAMNDAQAQRIMALESAGVQARAALPVPPKMRRATRDGKIVRPGVYEVPVVPSKQCWLCGDSDPAFQAKCAVPTCEMRAQPAQDREQAALKKQVAAYARLVASHDAQSAERAKAAARSREAVTTLQSEREANALLTSQVEALEAQLEALGERPAQPEKAAAQPLTEVQYTALAHRTASRYKHDPRPGQVEYTFQPHTLADFVRAVLSASSHTSYEMYLSTI